jgi:hypothetical protein
MATLEERVEQIEKALRKAKLLNEPATEIPISPFVRIVQKFRGGVYQPFQVEFQLKHVECGSENTQWLNVTEKGTKVVTCKGCKELVEVKLDW